MKQTPVASHNYFSNYHQYRTPTAATTTKKVSENNDSSTTNGYNQEKRPHTANFRSNSVSGNKD